MEGALVAGRDVAWVFIMVVLRDGDLLKSHVKHFF